MVARLLVRWESNIVDSLRRRAYEEQDAVQGGDYDDDWEVRLSGTKKAETAVVGLSMWRRPPLAVRATIA